MAQIYLLLYTVGVSLHSNGKSGAIGLMTLLSKVQFLMGVSITVPSSR